MLLVPSTSCSVRNSEFDFHVDARSQIELHKGIDGLRRRIDDVEETLVGAHLELLATLLVDMRRSIDREFLDSCRQGNRTPHLRARALGGRYYLARRRIEDAMIERLEPDTYVLAVHDLSGDGRQRRKRARPTCGYRLGSVTGAQPS